jgi:ABC-type multidrug transport system ATPase subunit
MNPHLRFTNLVKRYGAVAALDGVNLDIPRGSVTAVLGPNGAGKSTLFGCLLAFARPTSGQIEVHPDEQAVADGIQVGYVAERVAVYPQRTVWENAFYFARLKGLAGTEAEAQLARVGLSAAMGLKARQLSKGMLQRLGLAIGLLGRPMLLVLDEPFNGLDPVLLDTFQDILREEHARGATLLISTHTLAAVEPLATHVVILLNGRLALFDTVEALRIEHGIGQSLDAIYQRVAREYHQEVLA